MSPSNSVNPLAGKPAPASLLVDLDRLLGAYYDRAPDPTNPAERVQFGTSGHRGSSLDAAFNEAHILAIAQAVCDHRRERGISGPLFVGRDTHALSAPAHQTVLEVLLANGVEVRVDAGGGYCPTRVVSHAILTYNRGRTTGLADGIVITPSHNPPEDGGIKYDPPHGGPAEGAITSAIERMANASLVAKNVGVRRRAADHGAVLHDYVTPYVDDLGSAIDLEAVRAAGLRIGVDPLGGASVGYWARIAERYGLDLTVVEPRVDPRFAFMRVDHDGKIRMDCSSPYAMAGLVGYKDRYDLSIATDPDADRHGIVVPSVGLLPPNHYLCVAVDYLYSRRSSWKPSLAVGKTLVSTALIDRIAARLQRKLVEVPVGFKWFVDGLFNGALGFGGEESAGASFLRRDGSTWTTDKDGLLLALLAAEIRAVGRIDLGARYNELTDELGAPVYRRIDHPATPEQKARLQRLSAEAVTAKSLAGDPIVEVRTTAPGNGEKIGGLKIRTERAWIAARPSGTEAFSKLYAESFAGAAHLERVLTEGQQLIDEALATS